MVLTIVCEVSNVLEMPPKKAPPGQQRSRAGSAAEISAADLDLDSGTNMAAQAEAVARGGGDASQLKAMFDKIEQGQKNVLAKLNYNHKELKSLISHETKVLRDEVFLELANVTRRLTQLETRPAPLPEPAPFEPEVSIILSNLPILGRNETDDLLLAKVEDIVQTGLELPGIEVVNCKRLSGRERAPGLVIIEFPDLESKKSVLRAKNLLKNKPHFSNLFIRSAEGHTDRLMRLNMQTLLKHIGADRLYRFTGSGRLVKRDQNSTAGSGHGGPAPRRGDAAASTDSSHAAPPGPRGSPTRGAGGEGPS